MRSLATRSVVEETYRLHAAHGAFRTRKEKNKPFVSTGAPLEHTNAVRVRIEVTYVSYVNRSLDSPIEHAVKISYEPAPEGSEVVDGATARDALRDAILKIEYVYSPHKDFTSTSFAFVTKSNIHRVLPIPRLDVYTPSGLDPRDQKIYGFQQNLINAFAVADGKDAFLAQEEQDPPPSERPPPLDFSALGF